MEELKPIEKTLIDCYRRASINEKHTIFVLLSSYGMPFAVEKGKPIPFTAVHRSEQGQKIVFVDSL